jgi:1-acyl-sn-glycerol-3-phosphate acyltransferase
MNEFRIQARSRMALPRIRKRRLAWFTRYAGWYLRRNFHGVHLLQLSNLEALAGLPLLVCLNHPSWWDPLLCLYVSQRYFPERYHAAPIAAEGLAKYKFFEQLGFFGVPSERHQRGFRFLQVGEAVLSRPEGALWVTPQGAFTDVRRPTRLEPGVGHLAARLNNFAFLPITLEYCFWNERLPEAFICLGSALLAHGRNYSASEWNARFTYSLQKTAAYLAGKVQLRDSRVFEPVLQGRAGVGGVYDLWRHAKAKLQRKQWQPEHGGR